MIISKAERAFQVFNVALMSVIGLAMVLPLIHIIAQSFSSNAALNTGQVSFWPVGWTTLNYRHLLNDYLVLLAFRNSLIITVAGTLINLLATTSLAYPLSRPEYRARRYVLILVLVTIIFHAPLIPNYLLIKELNLLNTLWSVMLPSAISAFYLFVMRSFFINLPHELLDSGRIDGCGEISLIWRIVLPLSKPVMATMAIIYSVGNWNAYKEAVYYIDNPKLMPLQVRLFEIVNQDNFGQSDITLNEQLFVSPEGLKMAVIVLAILPIMLVYPVLQKHFVKGMLIGSIKS